MSYTCEPRKEYMMIGKRIAGIQISLETECWQRRHAALRFVDGEIGLETDVGSSSHPIIGFTAYGKMDGRWHAIGAPTLPGHKEVYDMNTVEGAALEAIAKQLPHQIYEIRNNQRQFGLPYRRR